MKNILILMMVLVFGIPLLSACGEETAETGAQADHAAHEEDSHEEGDDEHGHEDEADIVEMSQSAARAAGITLAKAELQKTSDDLELPAEIRTNPDRVANLSSPVSGIVTKLMVSEGDRVTAGQTLAVISSRELADLKAEYLASVSAEDLARTDLAREEKLYADQITAEADLLNARAAYRKASATRESSETKLHAIGIGHDVIDSLASAPDGSLSQFTLNAPIPGQIIRRDLTHGQSVDTASAEPLIVIVDTSTVWADITVYKEDLSRLAVGNEAILRSDDGAMLATGGISFISPVVEETSRTATARLVLDNQDGTLRPGQFVTAHIAAGETIEALLVPENAVQLVEGRSSVFVPAEDGFRPQPVQTGRKVGQKIEILSGLDPNDSYVSTGAFTLKAELEKDAFGDGHNH